MYENRNHMWKNRNMWEKQKSYVRKQKLYAKKQKYVRKQMICEKREMIYEKSKNDMWENRNDMWEYRKSSVWKQKSYAHALREQRSKGNFLTSLGRMCSVREKRFADIFQLRKRKKKQKRGKNKTYLIFTQYYVKIHKSKLKFKHESQYNLWAETKLNERNP